MSGLVTADDIRRWADMETAPNLLAELLARLVAATAYDRLREMRFPTGKGLSLGGWDGRTVTEGSGPFVPDGIAVWELGTQHNPRKKAQDDYDERTTEPPGLDRSAVTYIAVTARSWEGCLEWQDERDAERKWKAVRALDAQALYNWLLQAPAVHYWLSCEIGISTLPPGALGVEAWWQPWAESATVTLSPAVVHAGRADQAGRLRDRLANGPPGVVGVRAESRHEALAFVAATIMPMRTDSEEIDMRDVELAARSLVAESAESFRELARTRSKLILIPTFDDRDLVESAARRHIVVLPLGPSDRDEEVFIELGPVDARDVAAALRALGLSEQRAAELAQDSNGSLLALRRSLQKHHNSGGLPWASPETGRYMSRIALANCWDEGIPADRDVVATVVQRTYSEVQEILTPQLYTWEPAITKTGTVWKLRNPRDAWLHLHQYLTDADIAIFVEQAIAVLRQPDPRYELPAEQRYAGTVFGKAPRYSHGLVRGIATTTAVLGAVGGEASFDGTTSAQQWATHIVTDVLYEAPWETWASLDRLLPLLAEASPTAFLRALEHGLQSDAPLQALLASDVPGFFGGAPHVGLVWALERLLWSPEHRARATLALARLAELDPGGSTHPRPQGALVALISPRTRPHTVTTEMAVELLDLVRERHNDIAFRTMLLSVSPDAPLHDLDAKAPEFRRWARRSDGGAES